VRKKQLALFPFAVRLEQPAAVGVHALATAGSRRAARAQARMRSPASPSCGASAGRKASIGSGTSRPTLEIHMTLVRDGRAELVLLLRNLYM
jgi:hypothetical protein